MQQDRGVAFRQVTQPLPCYLFYLNTDNTTLHPVCRPNKLVFLTRSLCVRVCWTQMDLGTTCTLCPSAVLIASSQTSSLLSDAQKRLTDDLPWLTLPLIPSENEIKASSSISLGMHIFTICSFPRISTSRSLPNWMWLLAVVRDILYEEHW